MKIAYIHNCLWPSHAPGVNFVTYNADGFGKAGYDLTLFVRDNSEQSTSEILVKLFNIQDNRFTIQRITAPFWLKTNQIYFYQVYKAIKGTDKPFDVLITRHSGFLPYLIRLKRYYGQKGRKIKVIYEPHDFYYDLSLRTDLNKCQIRRSKKNQGYERKYLADIDGLIFLQPNFKTFYSKYLPSVPGVIAYTGVVKVCQNTGFSHKSRIIYIGSIAGDKYSGIYTLVNALELLPSDINLTIIGGRSKQEIEDFYQKIRPDLRTRITVTGWINRPEIEEIILRHGKIGTILFHQDFFADNFVYPLKFCDYISFGLPIICSFSEHNKLIREDVHGLFFENDNTSDLAQKIKSLWYDEKKLQEMSNHVHELAKERLWENRARTIAAFLENLFH